MRDNSLPEMANLYQRLQLIKLSSDRMQISHRMKKKRQTMAVRDDRQRRLWRHKIASRVRNDIADIQNAIEEFAHIDTKSWHWNEAKSRLLVVLESKSPKRPKSSIGGKDIEIGMDGL
jgi:hypothetical protein